MAAVEFTPLIPEHIDNALYMALKPYCGDRAVGAVDAVWDVIVNQPGILIDSTIQALPVFAPGMRPRDPRPIR